MRYVVEVTTPIETFLKQNHIEYGIDFIGQGSKPDKMVFWVECKSDTELFHLGMSYSAYLKNVGY